MKRDHRTKCEDTDCPAPEEVVAFVLDGSAVVDGEPIRKHIQTCERCRALVEEASDTIGVLRQERVDPVEQSLVDGVLARIPETVWKARPPAAYVERTGRVFFPWMPVRVAALVLIVIGAAFLLLRFASPMPDRLAEPGGKVAAVDKGIEWLLARQLPSGGWDVEELGGRPEYAPALNGLAVLALTRSDADTSKLKPCLDKATAFLLQTQADNGRFGRDCDGTMYNQGMATLALLESYCVTQDERLRSPIEKAVAFVRSRQSLSGGWGYSNTRDAQPNTSITAWQVQALLLADRLGWPDNRLPVRKALAWMSATVSGNGCFGYERPQQFPDGPNTLTMMGAHCLLAARRLCIPVDPALLARVTQGMGKFAGESPADYYAAYFYSSALSEADPAHFGTALAAARSSVIARQQLAGDDSGTWLADDRWGSSGGQIYSTSMALLALIPPHEQYASF